MSDCPDCTAAKSGDWGGFRLGCQSCAARAIARSPEAFQALRCGGDRAALSAMVDHIMGDVPRGDAVAMVREWVRVGDAQRGGPAA